MNDVSDCVMVILIGEQPLPLQQHTIYDDLNIHYHLCHSHSRHVEHRSTHINQHKDIFVQMEIPVGIAFSSLHLLEDFFLLTSRVVQMVSWWRLRLNFLGDLKQQRQYVTQELNYLRTLKAQNENYLRYTSFINPSVH